VIAIAGAAQGFAGRGEYNEGPNSAAFCGFLVHASGFRRQVAAVIMDFLVLHLF
jgi:hypothetical protein